MIWRVVIVNNHFLGGEFLDFMQDLRTSIIVVVQQSIQWLHVDDSNYDCSYYRNWLGANVSMVMWITIIDVRENSVYSFSSEEKEFYWRYKLIGECRGDYGHTRNWYRREDEFKIKAAIPYFFESIDIEGYYDWEYEVEKFRVLTGIKENALFTHGIEWSNLWKRDFYFQIMYKICISNFRIAYRVLDLLRSILMSSRDFKHVAIWIKQRISKLPVMELVEI